MAQDTPAPGGLGRPAQRLYLLHLLVLLLLLWPLVSVTYPPFLDYYSHLARVHITSNIEDFSEFYSINADTPPNLALDVIIRAFLNIASIETAGWLFLLSVIVVQATGVWVLNKSLQDRELVPVGPIFGCMLIYNAILTMGFLSYLFALGLMLWMIWFWLEVRERSLWWTLIPASVATIMLYFAHIVAFGIYGIVVAGYELQQSVQDRRKSPKERIYVLIKGAIPFLVPILLYVAGFQGDTDPLQLSQYSLRAKFLAIVDTLNTGASPIKLSVVGLAILAVLTLALGRMRFNMSMILPIGLLTLLFVVAPTGFRLVEYGFVSGFDLDDRLPLAIALLVCASVCVEFPTRRRAIILIGALVTFLAIRSYDLSRDFLRFDAEVKQSLQLFNKIEPGSAVAVAIDMTHPEYSWSARGRANWHVASLAALHAPVFVTTTHARASQHTMFLKGTPFSDLYAWQKELPIELASAEQLADAVARYREISQQGRNPGNDGARRLYLLLLMPYTLMDAAKAHGLTIGKTTWYLLLEINATERAQTKQWNFPGLVNMN